MVQKDYDRIESLWRSNPWDGQVGERRPQPYCHRRRTWCISWQLADTLEFCGFRHDAVKTSSWLQESIVDFASPQESGGQCVLWKLVAKLLFVVAMANFLVASLIWDITTTMDLTLIEQGNLRKSVKPLYMYGMSLTENLVQNYSDHFGNSQRSSLSPTGGCKEYISNYRKMATKTVSTAWTSSTRAMRITSMTQTTSTSTMTQTTTRASCTCEHGT